MTYDVITFGSATIDIYADTYDRKDIKPDMRYKHQIAYPTGAKILIQDLRVSVGGGGTNTAVTFARFGLKTGFCGCIGEDSNAGIIRGSLQKEGVEFIGHTSKEMTSVSVVLDSIEHDRTILTYKGASNDLQYKKINPHQLRAKLFYFSSLLGKGFETQEKIISNVNPETKIAFNPSSYQAKFGAKKLRKILERTNFLLLNKGEAQELLDSTNPHEKELLQKIHKLLHQEALVIITDGSRGIFCYDGNVFLHAPANNVKIKESTGAGDAFASGFLGALIKGKAVEDALKCGMANAESVIQHTGAKEIILSWNEAEKKARKQKVEIL
jgi:ribokinase